MITFILSCCGSALSITAAIISFLPESFILGTRSCIIRSQLSDGIYILLFRVSIFVATLGACFLVGGLFRFFRKRKNISGKNYSISVRYGDIQKIRNVKKVINFDECFTTTVGEAPHEIKPNSLCGQYLIEHPDLNMQELIAKRDLKPEKRKSRFRGQDCYKSGSIVPNGDDLLMAFVKLNSDGLGEMTLEDYYDSLNTLWKEIDKYYGSKNVCVPILGSGRTRINNANLSQQELLDIMIESYKLSRSKIRPPFKLIIMCKKTEGFSLNKIGQTL